MSVTVIRAAERDHWRSEWLESWQSFPATGRLDGTDLRVVQMWVAPDETDLEPGYDEADVTAALAAGDLVVVASGRPEHAGAAPVSIHSSAAALHVARMVPGRPVLLPDAPFGHLYVARGEVTIDHGGRTVTLSTGDAVRTTDAGAIPLAGPGGAEILFWEMHAGVR